MEDNDRINLVLVDDNPIIRFVLVKLISDSFKNLKIFSSGDGVQGLGYLFVTRPKIAIIDSTLPKYDGLEVVDYISQNRSFEDGTTKFILLHEGNDIPKLPADYFVLDKREQDFVESLIRVIGEATREKSRFQKVISFLGTKTIRYANLSDISLDRYANSRKLFVKFLAYMRWGANQIMASIFLSLFYLLVGNKINDVNIAESKNDMSRFRVRVYPILGLTLAGIFLLIFQATLFVGTLVTGYFFVKEPILAASYTWDGGGTDGTCGGNVGDGNKWSCAANWSSDIVPTSADTVTFNSTSTKDAVVDGDFGGVVTSVTISSGYTGTITLERSLQTSSTFTQSAGTFNSSNQSLDVNSTFTLNSGSTFTAPSTNMYVAGGFTINSGSTFTANGGMITFDGGPATLSCNNITFNLVIITDTTSTKTINSNCTLPLGSNPVIPGTGQIALTGTLTGSGTLTHAGSIFTMNTGSAVSGFSSFSFGNFTVTGATADFSAATSFSASGPVILNSGTFTVPNGATFGNAFTINGGTFNAPSGTLNTHGLSIVGGTFNHNNGTLNFISNNSTIACNNTTFNLVTFTSTTNKIISSDCNLPLGANPTIPGNFTLNGTLSGTGTLSKGVGLFVLNAGAALSGFTGFNFYEGTSTFTIAGATIDFSTYTTFTTHAAVTTNFTSGAITFPNNADFNGPINFSGGTLNAPAGNLYFGHTFNVSGSAVFNANNGTVFFDGVSSVTLTCNNINFNLVILDSGAITKNVSSSCNLPLGNNPTVSRLILNGTLSGTGTLTFSSHTNYNAGAAITGFSAINSAGAGTFTVAGANLDFSSHTSFISNGALTITSGSLALPDNSDINSTFTLSGGTFTAPSGTMTISTNFTISGSPTFNANGGTIVIDGSGGTLTCNSVTFNQVQFAQSGTKVVSSGCNLPLGNDPIIPGGITLSGSLSGTGTLKATAGILAFNSGSSISGFDVVDLWFMTIQGGTIDLSAIDEFKLAGSFSMTSGSITTPDSVIDTTLKTTSITGGTFNNGTSKLLVTGVFTLNGASAVFNGDDSDLDFNLDVVITNGTFTSTSATMAIERHLTITGGSFVHNNGTVTFDGATSGTIACNSSSFNNVTFTHTSAVKTVNSDCNLPLGDNPSLSTGVGPWVTLSGTLTGTGKLSSGGILTLNTGAVLNGFDAYEGVALTVAGMTLDMSGYSSFSTSSAVRVSSGSLTLPSGSDLNGITSNGSLYIEGGTFNAPSNMTIAGDFSVISGTFNHNNGTVILDGGDQSILGTTFYNLTKIVDADTTLTFPAGGTETILNDLTLKGSSNGILSLVSDTPGTAWNIDPQGGIDIEYLEVTDSNNINANIIQASGKNSTDGGGNTGWNFNSPIVTFSNLNDGDYTTDNTPKFKFNIADSDETDEIIYQLQVDNNSDFSSPEIDHTSSLTAQGDISYTHDSEIADGKYYYRIKATDSSNGSVGFQSANNGDIAFGIDASAPTGSITITDDSLDNNPLNVSLDIDAKDDESGMEEMIIWWNQDFSGTDWSSYSTTSNFTFAEEGTKKLYIKFKDNAGNESQVYSSNLYTILLPDSEKPDTTPTPTEGEVDKLYDLNIKVVDLDNKAIKGVGITLLPEDLKSESDENGIATFSGIKGGEHEIVIRYKDNEVRYTIDVSGEEEVFQIKIVLEERQDSTWIFISLILFFIILLILTIIIVKTIRSRNQKNK